MNTKLKSVDDIPGSLGLPFLGNLVEIFRHQELFYWRRYWEHGEVFKISIFGGKYVVFLGPTANRLVLKDGGEKLSSRLGMKNLKPILGDDFLLLQDGAAHRTSRRLILPVFHQQAIAAYFDTMKSLVESAVTDWGNKGTINLNDELRKLTLMIAVQIFLGSEKTDEIDRVCGWFDTLMAKERVAIVQWDVPFTARGQGQTARRKLMEYVRQTIQSGVRTRYAQKLSPA